MLVTFFRTILLYIVIVVSIRIMGKRQIGELQPSELVITILISNIATLPIEDTNIPLLAGLVPILVLVCLEVFTSVIGLKSRIARKLISGTPAYVIRDGVIDQKKLQDLRFSVDDLMEGLRGNGVFDVRDVQYAVVETTGKISVYKVFEQQEVTAGMLHLQTDQSDSIPSIVISDGKVIPMGLKDCQLTMQQLELLLQQNSCDIREVFLLTCDQNGSWYLAKKDGTCKQGDEISG